jgi:hypothetical protein
MEYKELDRHFTKPLPKGSGFFNCGRVPRKFKKKWKHILQGNRFDFLTLNQKLWYITSIINPNYNRFIIKQIIELDKK